MSWVAMAAARQPYPLSWDEQEHRLKAQPDHLATILFMVNTGYREQEVCQPRRDWEVEVPELATVVLLGHRNSDFTSHCSAPEIEGLPEAANRVCAVELRNDFAEKKNGLNNTLQAVVLTTVFLESCGF